MIDLLHIVVARKPLSEKNVSQNCIKWGTGGINIDGCSVETKDGLGGGGEKPETSCKFSNDGWRRPWMENEQSLVLHAAKMRANVCKAEKLGRFPANLIHDGSDEVVGLFPNTGISAGGKSGHTKAYQGGFKQDYYGDMHPGFGDTGSSARFFKSVSED